MSYYDFLAVCFKTPKPEGMRLGQYLSYQLSDISRTASIEILRHSDIDPFYDDDRVTAFLKFLGENWESLTKPMNSSEKF